MLGPARCNGNANQADGIAAGDDISMSSERHYEEKCAKGRKGQEDFQGVASRFLGFLAGF